MIDHTTSQLGIQAMTAVDGRSGRVNANSNTVSLSPSNGGARSAAGRDPEAVNRWLLRALVAAWKHYPAPIELAYDEFGNQRDLAEKAVNHLAEEGIVHVTGTSLVLSERGYATLEQVGRSDGRYPDLLQAGSVPEPYTSSSVILAIFRVHFELYLKAGRQ